MEPLLAATQFVDRIPESDWLRFGILLLILLAALQTVRMISRVNRYVLFVVFLIGTTSLFTSWVRYRNEPSFLTPMVDVVAPWFPKKLREFDV